MARKEESDYGKNYLLGAMKGGVGKSVSTLNLAYSLAELGKEVLAVDFDSQANLATCMGVEAVVAVPVTIGHLMMNHIEEEELQPLVDMWRQSNPNIVKFWWDVDRAVKNVVKNRTQEEVKGIRFYYQSGMLFIRLPSGRQLPYVKPRMGENEFGGESVTYESVGVTKKWEGIESYGPKFVENIVQAVSRDILSFAMQALSHCSICGHVHDELIIECSKDVSLDVICEQMGRTPSWAKGLVMRADGYETEFYKKD